MSDDWNWDDGHSDHSGYDDHAGEHHEAGFHADDTDPFGTDLAGHHDDSDLSGYDHDGGLEHDGAFEHDGGLEHDAGDPFAPDALVGDHHDWSAGLDEPDDGLNAIHGTDMFGADPDVAAYLPIHEFPAVLDLPDVTPVDGPPWTDPSMLGSYLPADGPLPVGQPDMSELAAYAGLDPGSAGAGWDALLESDDPATAALARFWSPPAA